MSSSLPVAGCRNVVVGCDFSEASRSALRLATAVASDLGARLEVVHSAFPEDLPRDGLPCLTAELRGWISAAPRPEAIGQVGATVALQPPDRVLRGLASALDECWLVVGAEGASSGFLRIAGSVAAALVRRPPAPVLVSPPRWRADGRPLLPCGRLLVALADGAGDRELVLAAGELVAPEGHLVAVHVLDASPHSGYPEALREHLAEALRRRAEEARERLDPLVDRESPETVGGGAGPELEILCQGPVHRDLAGLAESQEMDLIVVGSGETAARLVGVSTRPVLVLPRPAEDARGPAGPA